MSVPLPTIPGETTKAYKARLAAYKPNSWQIVRQFATYRRVLTMHDGWAEEGSTVDPPARTFRTAKEAEAYLSRHVGRHFNEFVARVKP